LQFNSRYVIAAKIIGLFPSRASSAKTACVIRSGWNRYNFDEPDHFGVVDMRK